jgi:hypothetical protein
VLKATTDSEYRYDVNAIDIDKGDVLQYSLAKKPKGMQIDSTSGLITWKPGNGQEGRHLVVVEVTDSNATVNQTFTITVTTGTRTENEWCLPVLFLTIAICIIYLLVRKSILEKRVKRRKR